MMAATSVMNTPVMRSPNFSRKTFIGFCVALFMVAFTLGVVPPMMPAIVREFQSSMGHIQSVLILASLVTAAITPTTENLNSVFGRRRVLLVGLILYAIGLLVTATSPTMVWFTLGYTLVLGMAASPLIDSSWAFVSFLTDEKTEKRAGAAMVLCSIAGGILGGLSAGFIASYSNWRFAFLPQLVLLLLVYGCTRPMPVPQQAIAPLIDWVSGLFALTGLGLTLVGVSLANEYGWWQPKQLFEVGGVVLPPFSLSIVPVLIAAGMVFLGLFYFWQRRAVRKGRPSLLRAGVLRRKVFVLGVLTATLHSVIVSGVQFNLYQYIPAVLKLNAFQTSLAVFPYTLATMVAFFTATFNRRIQAIAPRHLIQIGLALVCSGIFCLWQSITPTTTALKLLPALVIMGFGSGIFFTCIAGVAFSVTQPIEKAEASGVYNPLQNVGSSLGRGIFGTMLVSVISTQIVEQVAEKFKKTLDPITRQTAIHQLELVIQTFNTQERREFFKQLPVPILEKLQAIAPIAATEGMHLSLMTILLLGIMSLLLSFALPKRIPLSNQSPKQSLD